MPYPKEKKAKYDMEYEKKNIKRIPFNVQKDYYDEILKPAADKAGLKMNAFIKEAVQAKIDAGPAASGYYLSISKETLQTLEQEAKARDMTLQELFLEAVNVFIKEY